MPRRVARARGPVVAVAAAPDDPSVDAAIAIAAAAQENVVVLSAYDEKQPDTAGLKTDALAGILIETLRVPKAMLANERLVSSVLDRFKERLVVVTRGA